MSTSTNSIEWTERNDNTAILRPRLDGVAVDPTGQDFAAIVKALGADGLDDDSAAVLTLTTDPAGGLTIIDDPASPGTDVLLATVDPDTTPSPGTYRLELRRTAPTVTTFGTVLLVVADI